MKTHKAETALDTFKKCMKNFRDLSLDKKTDCDFKTDHTNTMQELIDCQLTLEEIQFIFALLDDKVIELNLEMIIQCSKTIPAKLQRQRVLWREENE